MIGCRVRSPIRLACLALVLLGPLPASAQPTIQEGRVHRPPPLAPQPACELWRGAARGGNDPSVQAELLICPGAGGQVTGQTQWSSLLSGYNVRDTIGSWSNDRRHLVLRDVRVREEHPQPNWRFCTIDHYDLVRMSPRRLEGSYDSAACRDHAALTLDLVGDVASPLPSSYAGPPTPPTARPHPPPRPPAPPSGGGVCSASSATGRSVPIGASAALFVIAGAAGARRRLSRSRRAW